MSNAVAAPLDTTDSSWKPAHLSAGLSSKNKPNEQAISLPAAALHLINVLEAAGYEAWCVGGFVRDTLLGRPCNDVDIATNALWPEVKRICAASGMRVHETGVKHGTVTVVVPPHSNDGPFCQDETSIEVTTFRHDGAYADARHPQEVQFVSTIEEDLARRDFTINALAFHPTRGIVDPYGGIADLQQKLIRVVGNPADRFSEDALRMLRACRFCSQLGFRIDRPTYQAMLEHKFLLAKVSVERIAHELDALLLGEHVHTALMNTVDVLAFVLPELAAMKGCAQVTKYHVYDVLEHTAYVVHHAPRTRLLRWAALCHDMGKPAAAFFAEDGVEHFYGHAKVSEKLAAGLMDRLRMSNAFKQRVCLLVLHHDRDVSCNARSIRRMTATLDNDPELFFALCDLKKADALAHAPAFREDGAHAAEQLKDTFRALLEADDLPTLKTMAINGGDIMALGVSQGPEVGQLLRSIFDEIVDGQVENTRDALMELARAKLRNLSQPQQ